MVTNQLVTSSTIQMADALSSCPAVLGGTRKVGIQAGHWQIDQLPDEQANLRYDLGTSSQGVDEMDINLDVAQKVVALLKDEGIEAEVLPATILPTYCASAFVAIHADGNDDPTVYGYKVAASSWDTEGQSQILSDDLNQEYGQITGMSQNPTITDNMTQYYAFNYQHFEHAIAPQTPGALIELGFVTNPTDRSLLTNSSQRMAQGIAQGILDFLNGTVASTPSASSQGNL